MNAREAERISAMPITLLKCLEEIALSTKKGDNRVMLELPRSEIPNISPLWETMGYEVWERGGGCEPGYAWFGIFWIEVDEDFQAHLRRFGFLPVGGKFKPQITISKNQPHDRHPTDNPL